MAVSGYKLLFDQNYKEVCESLRNLRRADLIALGTVLGLTYTTISNGYDFLRQVVAAWLNRQDGVLSQSGEPSWSVLADKLEEIGHVEIATDIRRRKDGGHGQFRGESEQLGGNLPTALSTGASVVINDQPHPNSSGPLCALDQTTVPPSSIQPKTHSKQDQPHTSASLTCHELPPAPKRTKLDQQSIREESDSQQLSYDTQRPVASYAYTEGEMLSPIVTVPTTVAESLRYPTSIQAQPTEKENPQSMLLPRAVNFSPPTLTTLSTTASMPPCIVATPLVAPSSTLALPSNRGQDLLSIRAEEASEAFREHRAALLVAVTDPLILANSLYSRKIISRETLNRVKLLTLTPTEKNMEIFDAIEAQIKTSPSSFHTLLDILNDDLQLHMFAGRLQQSYDQMSTSGASKLKSAIEPSNFTATMQLNRYLMGIYKSLPQSCDTKFPHLPEKAFITLAVIEKELVSRANADVFTKGTLHGHADEILKTKKPIAIEAVLEPPKGQHKNMKCVFIEGAPGVGKSTFAVEFCRMQEKLGIYTLTVLLRLREKHVQGIKTTTDLFYQYPDIQQAVTKEVIACQGKNMLFVLDGFDEFPADLRRDSFLVELIQGKHLPKCTVLVTSRPSATADLHYSCKSQIHRHIEILGFTHECIRQYAESMLSNQPDVLQDFLKYISKNPAIHGMMYIPLNSAIVLEVYKANRTTGKPVPCTMTQLYMELCLVLLRKYLVENHDPLVNHLKGYCKLEDIPNALKQKVLKLGKVALDGALRQQITFDHLPDGCVDLGFMNVSTELYLGIKSVVSYSFLHLTLQEFLAAFYVSQLSNAEQRLLFTEKLVITEDIFPTASHLDALWRFMAGLTGFKEVGWELVCRSTQVGPRPEWYYSSTLYLNLHYGQLLIHCLFEVQDESSIKAACDVIAKKYQKERHNSIVFIETNVHTPFDCYAVGYCVAASEHEWRLNLVKVGGNEVIEMLGCGLRSVNDVCGHLRVLNVAENSMTYEVISYFRTFPLNQIHMLDLHDNQLNQDALDCLAGALPHMVNLSCLDISRNPGSPLTGGLVKLFQELINTVMIDKLAVHEINLGPTDIQALSQLIKSRPTSSLKLKIGDKDISSECVALMMETLLSASSLETLELWWIKYNHENAKMFKLLEYNTSLVNLRLMNSWVGMNLALPYVAKALQTNKSLKYLSFCVSPRVPFPPHIRIYSSSSSFREYDIGSDSIKSLSEMLMVNKALTKLELASDKLTKDDVFTLSDALQHNSTLAFLCLTEEVTKTIDERIVPCHWEATAHLYQQNEFYGTQIMPLKSAKCKSASISICQSIRTVSTAGST